MSWKRPHVAPPFVENRFRQHVNFYGFCLGLEGLG